MSYTQTFYHIVLRTHRSIPAIVEACDLGDVQVCARNQGLYQQVAQS